MAGPLTINDGGLATKDPSDALLYEFRWGTRHLAATSLIGSNLFTITALRPPDDTALTKDQESFDGQTTRLRLSGGTVGALYRVGNTITTTDSPPQTIERSFLLLVEQR